jgi:hypothetical protein
MKLGMGHPSKRKIKGTGDVTIFDRKKAKIRVPLVVGSYLDKENLIASDFENGGSNATN